jgi:zinc protease
MKRLFVLITITLLYFGGTVQGTTTNTFTFTLPNCLMAIYRSIPENPIVSVQLFVKRGAIGEAPSQAGLAALTQTVMAQGTQKRNSKQLAADLENIGASLSSDVEHDFCSIGFSCLSDNAPTAMELLSDITLHPAFPENEIEKERANTLAGIKSRQDYIFNATQDLFNSAFYGTHPYSWPENGKAVTVKNFTRKDLQEWHTQHFTANNTLLVITGSISLVDAKALAEKFFSAMPKGGELPPLPVTPAVKHIEESHTSPKFQQAMLMRGWPCPPMADPDYPAIKVLNALMGGRMTGRLFVELREKMSLGYEVSSFYPSRRQQSRYVVYLGLKQENIVRAKKRLSEMIDDLRNNLVPEQELNDTKNYIRGVYLMDHQTANRQAWYLGWWEIMGGGYGLDETYISRLQAVSPNDIQRVARKYLAEENSVQIEMAPTAAAPAK